MNIKLHLSPSLSPFLSPLSLPLTLPLTGWDVEKGNVHGVGLNPDLLVSLTAPKECAKFFQGRHHYLGLRIIPKELSDKYRIRLPKYPGTDQIVKLQ